MAKQFGGGDLLYVSGSNLSGDVNRIDNCSSPRGVLGGGGEVNGINGAAMERLLTHTDGDIGFTALFNDEADTPPSTHSVLSALPTTDVVVSYLRGAAGLSPIASLVAKQVNYDLSRGNDGSMTFAVQALGQGTGLEWGKQVTSGEDTHASATEGASVDELGAAGPTAFGAVAWLQYRERFSGTPTFILEDSPDNSAWATLITFTGTGGASPFGERKTVTGNVDRWFRATTTGTFVNADFVMAVRRGTAADIEDLS